MMQIVAKKFSWTPVAMTSCLTSDSGESDDGEVISNFRTQDFQQQEVVDTMNEEILWLKDSYQ